MLILTLRRVLVVSYLTSLRGGGSSGKCSCLKICGCSPKYVRSDFSNADESTTESRLFLLLTAAKGADQDLIQVFEGCMTGVACRRVALCGA